MYEKRYTRNVVVSFVNQIHIGSWIDGDHKSRFSEIDFLWY